MAIGNTLRLCAWPLRLHCCRLHHRRHHSDATTIKGDSQNWVIILMIVSMTSHISCVSPCAPAEASSVNFFRFLGGKIRRKSGGNFAGFFGPTFLGNFWAFFVRKFVAPKKYFVPKFALQTCHPNICLWHLWRVKKARELSCVSQSPFPLSPFDSLTESCPCIFSRSSWHVPCFLHLISWVHMGEYSQGNLGINLWTLPFRCFWIPQP